MKVICLGDSLTSGFALSRRKTWVEMLSGQLSHEFVNKGIPGDTTGGILSRLHKDVVEESARCVILMGGTNDLIAGGDLGIIKANIMAMVHQSYFYGVLPVVGIPIIPRINSLDENKKNFADFESVVSNLMELRDWVIFFGRTFGVHFMDFSGDIEWTDNMTADGLHPNEEGNRQMAEYVKRSGIFLQNI